MIEKKYTGDEEIFYLTCWLGLAYIHVFQWTEVKYSIIF